MAVKRYMNASNRIAGHLGLKPMELSDPCAAYTDRAASVFHTAVTLDGKTMLGVRAVRQ